MSGIVNGIYNEFENAIAEGTTNATATAKRSNGSNVEDRVRRRRRISKKILPT